MNKHIRSDAKRLAYVLHSRASMEDVVETLAHNSLLTYYAPQLKKDMEAIYDYIGILESIIENECGDSIIDETIEAMVNEDENADYDEVTEYLEQVKEADVKDE